MRKLRTLIRVEGMTKHSAILTVPAWEPTGIVLVRLAILPAEVQARIVRCANGEVKAPYLHADVDLGAAFAQDLAFENWELE